jgi:hypothetical protein
MKRNTILTILILAAVVAIAIFVIWPKPSHASWGNSFRDRDGPTIRYRVFGHSSGELIAGVLINRIGLKDDAVLFSWKSERAGSEVELSVNGQLIEEAPEFVLHFNLADGTASKITLPKEEAKELFGRDADPTQEQLLEFLQQHAEQ